MKLRTLFLFLIFFFAIFSAYQYSSNINKNSSNIVETSKGDFRVFAFNYTSASTDFVLRANSSTERAYIELGTIDKDIGVIYTGALALSNENLVSIELTGVEVEDTLNSLSPFMQIYLHNNSDKLAENEGGILIFDQGNSNQFSWNLSAGDGNYSTAGNFQLSYSTTDNIYYSPNNINASNQDFVWVEIKILASNKLKPNRDYAGYITFYYKYGAIKLWYHAYITP